MLDCTGDHRTLRDDLHGAAADPCAPPPGAAVDWTVPQHWDRFTEAEHDLWDELFDRQVQHLRGRVVDAFWDGLTLLKIAGSGIPDFAKLNGPLEDLTGWTIVAVPGLVPDHVFFDHLRNRRFPAGNFIRTRSQMDYLEEPDVFHDIFGHVPLLVQPDLARWTERLGEYAIEAEATGTMNLLSRLYWRTVEFGLASHRGALRIYGAGIASSRTESAYALESPAPRREAFDIGKVLATPYRSDIVQDLYFVVEDFADLVANVEGRSWADILESMDQA